MVGFRHSDSSSLMEDDDMGVPAPVFEYVAAPVLNKCGIKMNSSNGERSVSSMKLSCKTAVW